MKTIHVTNIEYNFGEVKNINPYTLPQDMTFIVDDRFNKYVETAKLIKETTSYYPKSYFIKEDQEVQKYINYENVSVFLSANNEYASLHDVKE